MNNRVSEYLVWSVYVMRFLRISYYHLYPYSLLIIVPKGQHWGPLIFGFFGSGSGKRIRIVINLRDWPFRFILILIRLRAY